MINWSGSARGLLLALGLLAGGAGVAAAQAGPTAATPAAGLVDIGGRRLFLECQGSGGGVGVDGRAAGFGRELVPGLDGDTTTSSGRRLGHLAISPQLQSARARRPSPREPQRHA
jgi:hypothetical protein